MTSLATMVPEVMTAVVVEPDLEDGLFADAAVVMSCTVQLQPFGAVAEFPIVIVVVQDVDPEVVNLPAVAPPVVVPALSPHPAFVVNFVPSDMTPASFNTPLESAAEPFPTRMIPAAERVNPVSILPVAAAVLAKPKASPLPTLTPVPTNRAWHVPVVIRHTEVVDGESNPVLVAMPANCIEGFAAVPALNVTDPVPFGAIVIPALVVVVAIVVAAPAAPLKLIPPLMFTAPPATGVERLTLPDVVPLIVRTPAFPPTVPKVNVPVPLSTTLWSQPTTVPAPE